MKTQIVLVIIIVLLFGVYSFSIYELGKSKARTQTIRDTDTLITYVDVRDTLIIPKFIVKYITQIDTINGIDTIFIDKTQYIAQLDTTYEDDLAKLKVEFVSDIPLSKKSYFNLALDIKRETIFIPTYKAYEPDKWGVGFGIVGHFTDSVKVNLFGNISYKIINFKHFELPITAEIELNDDFSIRDKIIKAEGRFKF